MTTSTAALGLSAHMTHQTPAGQTTNQVRETEEELKCVSHTFSGEISLRSFKYSDSSEHTCKLR